MREGYLDFVRGIDVSTLKMIEELGGIFYENGEQKDPIQVLASHGSNYSRLRLWVDPYDSERNPYGGGTNDYPTTLKLAKRSAAQGMKILLDFHYSDFWADPGSQIKPKEWKELSFEDLKLTVYNYTKNILEDLKNEGIIPETVQVGNEILAGMLWDDGLVGNARRDDGLVGNARRDDFTPLAELLAAGIAGVRDCLGAQSKIILHLDKGGDNAQFRWWFDAICSTNVELDYDIIGLTYYPMWNGTMDELLYNLNDISARYDKDVLIVETAYGWTTEDGDGLGSSFSEADVEVTGYPGTPQGQIDIMNDLEAVMLNVANNRGLGYFYWEPGWILVEDANWVTPAGQVYLGDDTVLNNPWDNLTVFDFGGHALESVRLFNIPNENLLANPSFEEDSEVTDHPTGWQVWGETEVDYDAVKTEWGGYTGDWKLTFWKDSAYHCSVYQILTDLEDGLYTLSAWIENSGGQEVIQIYAKNYGGEERVQEIPVSDINWNKFVIDNIEVTNGQCEVGLYSVANAGNWVNMDLMMFRKRK